MDIDDPSKAISLRILKSLYSSGPFETFSKAHGNKCILSPEEVIREVVLDHLISTNATVSSGKAIIVLAFDEINRLDKNPLYNIADKLRTFTDVTDLEITYNGQSIQIYPVIVLAGTARPDNRNFNDASFGKKINLSLPPLSPEAIKDAIPEKEAITSQLPLLSALSSGHPRSIEVLVKALESKKLVFSQIFFPFYGYRKPTPSFS